MRPVRYAPSIVAGALLLGSQACADGPLFPAAAAFPDEPAPDPQPEVVAFVDVNVVPLDRDEVLADQTVIVRADRIETIAPAADVAVPDGAFQIEGLGRYLVPGLADMHVHTTSQTFEYLRNDFVLFLANGVTTVRVMWGGTGVLAERDRIEAGEILGPTLLVASPGLDAPGGTWTGSTAPVTGPADARQRVADHAAAGFDFIKVYNDLDVPTYDAIIDEADSHGLPVVGHVPSRVGIERVQDAGQLTLEHFIGMKLEAASTFNGGILDMDRIRGLAERSRDRGVWHTPTITVDALSTTRARQIQLGTEIGLVSPGMREFFETGFYHGLPPSVAEREATNHRAMIATVHEAGAGLLVGTDAGFGWILPGYSIHDELSSFHAAGLSRFEALAAATSEAARSVGQQDEFGSLAAGRRADLLLLTGDPRRDLHVLKDPSGVMVRGRWLSRGTLADMLETIRNGYSGGD